MEAGKLTWADTNLSEYLGEGGGTTVAVDGIGDAEVQSNSERTDFIKL
jgi:hypothetical protein